MYRISERREVQEECTVTKGEKTDSKAVIRKWISEAFPKGDVGVVFLSECTAEITYRDERMKIKYIPGKGIIENG